MTDREKRILELLNQNGYLSVEKMAKITYSSPSSIRRDLTCLQTLGLLKRTHGGATVQQNANNAEPLSVRMGKNIAGKRKIAKEAQRFLQDDQTVMLDGSSTAGFLVPYIARKKNVTLFTNNMQTALSAVNYGIRTFCIGGLSLSNSAVLSGEESYRTVSAIHPDLLFFSSYGIDRRGIITDPTPEENYLRSLMIRNAKKSVFLCDSTKFNVVSTYELTNLKDVDEYVFDEDFADLSL